MFRTLKASRAATTSTTSDPSRSRGRRTERGQATPSIVAVVSVVVVVAAMVAFFAGGSDQPADPQPQAQTGAVTAKKATPEPAAAPTKESRAVAKQADERDRAKPNARDKRRRPTPEPRVAPEPEGVPDVYVEVYNNTTVSGLAASTAAELQDGGWQVVGVDNWHGDIPASTVYYPDGMFDEADQLAEELGFARVRGAVAPMKFDRLTVILTPDAA
jgi:hypothetical protein